MPAYDYKCKACGHSFEIEQKITADALTECPKCNQPELKRIIGGVGIAFKGNGFYVTDNKKNKSETKAPACADSCPAAKTCTK
jgi:putative FmdB family regulatory protein